MHASHFLFSLALLLTPLCLISTTWLYSYPLWHGCRFPQPDSDWTPTSKAPFRLLALGDPQLEGDSSLPKPSFHSLPSLATIVHDARFAGSWSRRQYLLRAALSDYSRRLPKESWKWVRLQRKRLDLWGNDWYLAHIVRCLRWWTRPSHVSVLGDLLGSQWIGNEEFERRGRRFWERVFGGLGVVGEGIMGGAAGEEGQEGQEGRQWGGRVEVLGEDKSWENRVINIAGNHDIGYAGDLDEGRVERFERAFGKVNWDIWFTLPRTNISSPSSNTTLGDADNNDNNETDPPALRLIILNSMNLDTPALSHSLQTQTYSFLNHVISTSRPVTSKTHATILLTHIPLYKEPGICVDSPFFDFFDTGSGVKEQNMLSEHSSKGILEGIFGLSGNEGAEGQGLGRRGVVINGHDHEGCDVLHYFPRMGEEDGECAKWYEAPDSATATEGASCTSPSIPHIREITLRSMMGDFSGHAGFLSAWFDASLGEHGEWRLEFQTCGFGIQHWWWGVMLTSSEASQEVTWSRYHLEI
ncbi:uncharacterized protein BDR25DRAFT_337072 [Lindgomyces ingoldianus]|uniref:Uncharacterized protein n=1 Tax=Lindgomyces ingoldianus TaxID=673940 RepID=A0ACB6QEP2_9PLEO|nr:uncharacterized protein BDR25DRAFT_337072 [Lindgomyces ingoldianus]KAF2465330.1 hypothetical protein BDR25DRAFT_337072 [Lindgomyces ingoldianus]